jgi:hypothetical protein
VRRGASEIARLRTPGWHDGRARQRIDRQDALNFGQRQHDAVRGRQRAAGQARARAARDDGHARGMAQAQDRDDLPFVSGSATAAGSSRYSVRPSHSYGACPPPR